MLTKGQLLSLLLRLCDATPPSPRDLSSLIMLLLLPPSLPPSCVAMMRRREPVQLQFPFPLSNSADRPQGLGMFADELIGQYLPAPSPAPPPPSRMLQHCALHPLPNHTFTLLCDICSMATDR